MFQLLDMFEMVDFKRNREYVMSTQYPNAGGFSKWPDSYADAMHTYLGNYCHFTGFFPFYNYSSEKKAKKSTYLVW